MAHGGCGSARRGVEVWVTSCSGKRWQDEADAVVDFGDC